MCEPRVRFSLSDAEERRERLTMMGCCENTLGNDARRVAERSSATLKPLNLLDGLLLGDGGLGSLGEDGEHF